MYAGKGDVPFIKVYNLTHRGNLDFSVKPTFIDRSTHVGLLGRSVALPGDVLINIVGPPLGKVAVVPDDHPEWNINQAIVLFRPRGGILNKYLAYAFLTDSVMRRVTSLAKATAGQFNIGVGMCRRLLPIPLASTNEQKRIVGKVEELFSDLDAGVVALERANSNLRRYRTSVLKAAVEGALTETWRAEHPGTESASKLLERILAERRRKWEADQLAKFGAAGKEPPKNWKSKYVEPTPADTSGLPPLPKNWCWASVQQLGEVQLGRQRSPKNRSDKFPTKYVRAANLTEAGLDLADVLDMEFQPSELDTYRLHPGDVLLSEASGSPDQVGKPVVWNGEIENCCFQNTVIRLRPIGMPSEYPLVVFRHYYRSKLFAKVSAGVGINHLSAAKFSVLTFPLAPLDEQRVIAAEVEERLSQIAAAERQIESNLLRATRLRQSILKQAFEGKLVLQDPADEPATVLLERIKAASNGAAAKIGATEMRPRRKAQPRRVRQ